MIHIYGLGRSDRDSPCSNSIQTDGHPGVNKYWMIAVFKIRVIIVPRIQIETYSNSIYLHYIDPSKYAAPSLSSPLRLHFSYSSSKAWTRSPLNRLVK